MGRNVARKLGSFVLSFTAGCGLFGGEDDPSISLSASSTAVVLQQAATSPVTLEIGRTNFEKPIALSVEGTLPAGVTATFTQNPVAASASTTTLNIAASGAATPGTAALTIKATGEGITEKALLIDITVNVRGSHTVALSSATMTVAQGGGGQSTVLLARQSSNAGSVTLAATGAPAGMTVTFGESPTTSAATSVNVTATGSVAPGSYTISISGTQPGVTNPTPATLAITVVTAPATTSISVPFCASGIPVWFAYQNEGFLWQRVTATGNAFNFSATDKLGIAFAFQDGNASDVRFYLATRAELAGITDRDCLGPKNHPGTTSNVAAGQTAIVSMGPAFEVVANNAYLMEGAQDRALDLVSTRGSLVNNSLLTPDRMVIRRGINLSNNTSIPVIDFQGVESFAPTPNTLTVAGMEAGETVYIENVFQGTTTTTGLVFSAQSSANTHTLYSVPAASQVAGDMSELYIDAFNAAGTVAHTMVTYYATPGDRNESMGPLLTIPTVSVASTSPFVRERGQLSSQTAYNTAARFVYLQGSSPNTRYIVVVVTAGYLGGVPTTWDVIVPDVSGVAGFNSSWMHTTGLTTPFSAEAFSAPGATLFGGLPTVGQTIKFAYRQSSVATSVGSSLRASGAQRRSTFDPRRGILNPPPQYLRR